MGFLNSLDVTMSQDLSTVGLFSFGFQKWQRMVFCFWSGLALLWKRVIEKIKSEKQSFKTRDKTGSSEMSRKGCQL